jgi:hypothetical protein
VIGTPDGYKQAADKGLFVTICRPVVEEVGVMLEEMLHVAKENEEQDEV